MTSWQRVLLLVVLAYAAAVANSAICPRIAVAGALPDLLAVLAIVWICIGGSEPGFVAAAAIGLASDVCGSERLGVGMACFLLIGFALEAVQRRWAHQHPAMRLAAALVAVVALQLLRAWCDWLQANLNPPLASMSGQGVAMGLYTATACGMALAVFHWVARPRQFT